MSALADPTAPGDNARRDRWGRYLVVPPGGGKPTGYTRATTVAKALDDTSNLMAWSNRMTALGLAQRPDLLALVQAADPDDRDELNKVCERAKEAGGATARRDLGTALHTMVEKAHADPEWKVPDAYAADVAAVQAAIAAAGYEVVDGMSEVMVVLDRHTIAGTSDLTLRRRSTGVLRIADIKTGASVNYGALAWAIQLSVYAQADARYVQGSARDGSQDQRLPMPEVDRDTALILHVQPGSGVCDVHELDIAAGAEALEVSMAVREWRKRKGLLVPFTVEGGGANGSATHGVATPPNTPAVEVEPSATAPTTAGKPAGATSPAPAGDPSPLTDSLDAVLHQARVAWVLNRIEAVKERGEDATRRLGTAMPDGPTPKAVREGTPWTAVQLEAWNAHVTAVEAEFELPFSDEDPAVAAERAAERAATEAARVAAPVAAPAAESAPATEEGGPFADPAEVASIRAVLASMNGEPAQRGLVEHVFGWSRTGLDTGHPWSMSPKGQPTPLRRWAICAAAIGLLDIVDLDAEDPDAAVRLALALVVGDDALKPSVPVGQTLGTLTFDEAQRVAAVVDTHRLVPGPDGTPRLEVVA